MDIDWDAAMSAIRSIESDGSGGYRALGPATKRGDRAYGAFQVMGANIPQWTKEALGRQMTPQEFHQDDEAQNQVFKHRFGLLANQYGNVNDAASAWFTGRPQSQGGNAKDQLGTSGNKYVDKFAAAYGGGAPAGGLPPGAMTPEPGILAAGTAPNPADMPVTGAQEAQGVMTQQGYQPTLTDSLDKLSAAFFMRDNPQAAQTINNSLRDKMTNQVQSLRRAQAASERWQMGKPYKTSDGQYGATQINPQTGESRFVPMAPPKEEEKPISRPEEAAVAKVNTARAALGQLDVVSNHIDTLREALALGNFDVGPDKTGAMVIRNLTGNSTENDRKLKAMESSIIGAATAIAQTQKGALTNFKFAKDMEMVMPSFAANDKKAAYESLTRVAEGVNEAYNATVETIRSGAKAAPKYAGKMLKPDGDGAGEEVDTIEFFGNKAKDRAEREKRIRTLVPAFMASPGRGQATPPPAPEPGFVKNGWRFKGGNPADQSNWTKEN